MTSRWRRTMLKPRQKNEDGLDVREANHRMMNMLAILLALFHRNFSKFSDQSVRGAVTKFENQIMAASELLRTISSTSSEACDGNEMIRMGLILGFIMSLALLFAAYRK